MEPPHDPAGEPVPPPSPGSPIPQPPPYPSPPGNPIPPPPYAPQPGASYPPQGYATASAVPTTEQPPSLGQQIIPTKNPMALAGYYTGVFSLIPCFGLIIGPIALLLGILAMKTLKQNPMLPGKGHAITALVLGGLSTLANWGFVLFVVIAGMTARP